MKYLLARTLTSVPNLPRVRLEIENAIRNLAEVNDAEQFKKKKPEETAASALDIAEKIAREIVQDLRRAGFRPDQPRWPKRSGENSGRWSGGAGEGPVAPPKPPTAEAPPRTWTLGHNQGPPLDDPPEIPRQTLTESEATRLLRRPQSGWLERA